MGYEDGKKLEADTVLKPVGSKEKLWVQGMHGGSVLKQSQSEKQLAHHDNFIVPSVKPINKHTTTSGYNSLADPHLKSYFKKRVNKQNVTRQGLATDDLRVLDSPKKAHQQRYFETLSKAKTHELEEAKRQTIVRRHKSMLENKTSRDKVIKSFRGQQESEKKQQAQLIKKAMVNRVSVSETQPTERDQEYIDKNNELADTRKEMDSIKQIQLDAAKQFKEAAINRRLSAEVASRKQAVEERIEADAQALATVKETIEKSKAAQKATKEKIERTAKARQDKVKAESKAFQETMHQIFAERTAQQKREIAERAEKRRLAGIALSEKRAALEAEERAEQKRAEDAQRALMTTLRAESFREEQLRKMEDEARKEASRATKELRLKEQRRKAEDNRIAVAEEKEKMRQLEIARLAEIERKKIEQKERNAEGNARRLAALAEAEAEKSERIRRETQMDLETQNAIKKANADAYVAEQKLLWEKAMKEAERDEIIKKREIKQQAKQAKIDEFERQKAERVEKARQEKVAADKLKAQAKLKETMIKMQQEVDRTIANLAKGYG